MGALLGDEDRLMSDAVGARSAPADETDAVVADLVARRAQNSDVVLKASLNTAVPVNPDNAARVFNLAKATGLPLPTVERNEQSVEEQKRVRDLQNLFASSPILMRKFSDPEFAKLAHDDAESLSITAQVANMLRPSTGPEASFSTVMSGIGKSVGQGAELVRQGIRAQFADMFGLKDMGENAKRKTAAAQSDVFLSTPSFESDTAQGLYSGATSLARQIPGIAASIMTRSTTPMLAAAGVQTEAEAYGKYRARDASGLDSFVGAVGEGAVEVATEMMPMSFLTKQIGRIGVAPFVGGLLAREVPSEEVATLLQDAIDTAIANPDKTWRQYLQERPGAAYQTLLATLVQSGAMGAVHGVAKTIADRNMETEGATHDAAALQKLFEVAAGSKTRERTPQTFAQFVDEAVQDGPVPAVYVDAATFMQTMQDAGMNEQQLATAMPETAAQITEAQQTGGRLRIPLGELTATLAGTGVEATLLPHLATSAEGATLKEAHDEQFIAETKQYVDKLMAEHEFTNSIKESALTVERELLDQFKTANRFTPDVNSAYAKLASAFYMAQSQRLGITPEQMYVKYPLQIQAKTAAGDTVMDQVGSPAFDRWFEGSKVVDDKGKPLVVYHGTNTDFAVFDRAMLGSATGARSSKLGFFFTDSTEVARTFTSKDGGNVMPVMLSIKNPIEIGYRTQAERKRAKPTQDPFDELQRAIAKIAGKASWKDVTTEDVVAWRTRLESKGYDGVVLRNTSMDAMPRSIAEPYHDFYIAFDSKQIKSAIGNRGTYDANDPNILHQAAPPVRSAAFRRWFKKSKVVDENGKPLIVYHGTTGDFTTFDKNRANAESDMGAGFYFTNEIDDVSANYAGEGPDLTNRLERRVEQIGQQLEASDEWEDKPPEEIRQEAERLAREQLAVEHAGLVMPVYLSVQNPVQIGGDNETYFDFESNFDPEDEDSNEEPTGLLVEFVEALRNEASRFDDGSTDELIGKLLEEYDGMKVSRLLEIVKSDEQFGYYVDYENDGNVVRDEIVRRAFARIGFDGIIDKTVDVKFGSQRRIGKSMEGMNYDTTHYIVFEPGQIKSAIGNNGKYSTTDTNILHQNTIDNATGEVAPGPIWISKLTNLVSAAKMGSAPAAQWKTFINGLSQKGVGKDEVAFSGVLDWLDLRESEKNREPIFQLLDARSEGDEKEVISEGTSTAVATWKAENPNALVRQVTVAGTDKVTKDEIVEYLNANAIIPQERRLGDGSRGDEQSTTAVAVVDEEDEEDEQDEITDDEISERAEQIWQDGLPDEASEYARMDVRENYEFEVVLRVPNFKVVELPPDMWRGDARFGIRDLDWGNVDYVDEISELEKDFPNGPRETWHEYQGEEEDGFTTERAAFKYAEKNIENAYEGEPTFTTRVTDYNGEVEWGNDHEDKSDAKNELDRLEQRQIDWAYESYMENASFSDTDTSHYEEEARRQLEDERDGGNQRSRRPSNAVDPDAPIPARHANSWQLKGGRDYVEIPMYLPGIEPYVASDRTHFGDIGGGRTVAWLRVKTFDGADGKPVVVAQEIQSKRGQDGRESGFKSDGGAVPDAPFVADTQKWVALVMKRLIRYAVDQGAETVAWTRGDQQVEIYGSWLKRQVDTILWQKVEGGIQIAAKQGDQVKVNQLFDEKELERNIGASMLKLIVDSPEQSGEIAGDNLTIDDQGMNNFYGNAEGAKPDGKPSIITIVANKVIKQLGGTKVEPVGVDLGRSAEPPASAYDGPTVTGAQLLDEADNNPNWRTSTRQTAANIVLRMNGGMPFNQAVVDEHVMGSRSAVASIVDHFGGRLTLVGMESEQMPGFKITEEMRTKALGGQSPFLQKKGETSRGQISFSTDITQNPSVITLLHNADLSTFLHELGHFQLEVLTHVASQPDAPPEIASDVQKLMQWFGVPNIVAWQGMTLEQKRPYHEQLARGFESYLFEGKAPNLDLQGIFQRFRAWLLNVYRQLTALNVTLTDEVRGVMDRMIATNSEIVAAEQARAYTPLFESAEKAGMTAAEWDAYQANNSGATQDAVDTLQTRSLRDMQWLSNAKDRTIKRLQRGANDKRKGVRAEVAAEVNAQPVYQALQFLTKGILDGEQKVGGKLSIDALKAMYGDGPAAPWRYLATGKYGTVTSDVGLHPDQVAELFGFDSGDALVRAILAAEPANVEIDGKTDQRMLERYGDLADENSIERAANEAIHNDARSRFVATELHALNKALGSVRFLTKAAKEFAANLVARKKVKDIRPAQYEAAEARAAKASERAFGKSDTVLAATQKRNQLVNNYAARAATDALAEVDKGVAYLRRVGDAKSIDGAYREQIATLLDRFDLRKLGPKALQRKQSLLEWVESQREQGFEPVIDAALLDEAQRISYKELTLEQFRGLVDAVRNIEHLGRLKNRLLVLADKREFKRVVDEAAASIHDNAKKSITPPLESNTWAAAFKSGVAGFFAMHRKFSSLIRELDGYADNGALYRLFLRPMNAAGDAETVMREQATMDLTHLFKQLDGAKLTEKRYIPEIKASLSREGRIMVALNTGNAGNLQRLLDGEHWTERQVQAIVDSLTINEMGFVQSVWDYVGTYRTRIGEQQKRLTGMMPEWVEPIPVKTAHGTYRGGYIPVKYDTTRSTRSLSDEAAAGIMDQWRGAKGVAKTRDSFTKARANKVVDRPLRKDFGVITQHVTEVTHRLAWQEYLIDANRLLRAGPVDAAIREHYGPEVLKAMRDTMADIAAGEVGAQSAFEKGVNYVRTGATVAGLGWRLTTALLQPIGLTQSMVRIGPKWVGKGLAQWIGDAAKMENTAARIYAKSDMMRLRGKTMQREISEIMNTVRDKNSAIEGSYFYLIQKMQLVADIPTWLGQYTKSIEGGETEAASVAQADAAVLEAQGGGQIKDLSAAQRGGPLMKLFTNFYSFFNTTYNLTSQSVGRTNFKNPLSVGRMAVDMLLLYSVPAVLGTLMKAALHGGDDDNTLDKLAKQLIADQLTYLLGTMVGLREAAGGLQTVLGLPGDYSGPASVRLFAEIAKLGKQIGQGEVDEALLKAADSVGGILFHYPAGQINATADGIYSLVSGKTDNPGALIVGSNNR